MSSEREIGELSARVAILERDVLEIKQIATETRDAIMFAKGSGRLIVGLLTAGIAIGTLIATVGMWIWPRT